jgi:hypothetical protein
MLLEPMEVNQTQIWRERERERERERGEGRGIWIIVPAVFT